MPLRECSYMAELSAEAVRRFVSGDSIVEIAEETHSAAEDIEEAIREYVQQYELRD